MHVQCNVRFLYLVAIFISYAVVTRAGFQLTSTKCTRQFKVPKPGNTVCGDRGSLSKADEYKEYTVTQPSELDLLRICRDSCFDSTTPTATPCQAWRIDRSNGQCRLFRKPFAQMGFVKSSATTGPQHFSKDCFYTTCETAVEVGLTDYLTDYDDQYFNVTLPFPVHFFSFGYPPYTKAYVSMNGFISFSDPPSTSYLNQNLPSFSSPAATSAYLPNESICGYWDDLGIVGMPSRDEFSADLKLSYFVRGIAPSRSVSFRWKANKRDGGTSRGVLDMEIQFFEDGPNQLLVTYNNVDTSHGVSATVGAQSKRAENFIPYSYNTANIDRGKALIFDTQALTVEEV